MFTQIAIKMGKQPIVKVNSVWGGHFVHVCFQFGSSVVGSSDIIVMAFLVCWRTNDDGDDRATTNDGGSIGNTRNRIGTKANIRITFYFLINE